MKNAQKRTWAEIDIDAVENNYRKVRSIVPENAKMCCVVKANAYGHGDGVISGVFEALGADYFAVSNIEEALRLRKCGIRMPILVLGYTDPECAAELSAENITQTVYDYGFARALAENAAKAGVKLKVHIKIDTGMGRIGFRFSGKNDESEKALEVCRFPEFETEGIFTHFAVSDENSIGANLCTGKQFENFNKAVEFFEKSGVSFKYRHASNSASVVRFPEHSLNMVRPGIILYGLEPSKQSRVPGLIPAMSIKSTVSMLKHISKGDTVSYGMTFTAKSDTVIATVPCGYADGFLRANSNRGSVIVHGKKCPIVGRVCMDQMMVDVTSVPDVKLFDTVTVMGSENGVSVTADDIASVCGTINYEMICAIAERVPRVYISGGTVKFVSDKLLPDLD